MNAICEIGDFFPFLPLCLWRIVDYQRFAETENGSDLIKNGAPSLDSPAIQPSDSGVFYFYAKPLVVKGFAKYEPNP